MLRSLDSDDLMAAVGGIVIAFLMLLMFGLGFVVWRMA